MHYYKLYKISEGKIKSAEFQILPIQIDIFSQFRTIQIQAFASCAKLNNKETFCQKILRKRRFDHNNVIERPFFSEEVVTCREIAGISLVNKHHYASQLILFDVTH